MNALKAIATLTLAVFVYATYLYVVFGLVLVYRLLLDGSVFITVTILVGAVTLPIIAVVLLVGDEKGQATND